MTSTAQLPADLLGELVSFTEPFQATSSRFLTHLSRNDEDTFPRVCELHNTLELLSSSSAPLRHLCELRGGGVGGGGAGGGGGVVAETNQDAEDLLSFLLNAEFVLYALYSEYELSLNPSLAHWVGICREFEKYARVHTGDWGLRERVLKIRAAFVKGILGDQGAILAKISPKDFAMRGLDFNVNLDSFRDALHSQGIYDDDDYDNDGVGEQQQPEPDIEAEAQVYADSNGRYSETPSVRTETTRTPATPSTPSHHHHPQHRHQEAQAQAQVSSVLLSATSEELTTALTDRLLTHLNNNTGLLLTLPLELLSIPTFSNLFNRNPTLTRGLVSLFLTHSSKAQRRDLLTALEFLPVSLGSLEMLNDLVATTRLLTQDETMHLVHGVLSNGMRAAETMEARQMQTRVVRLLCLFLQSVLRCEVVTVPEVYYLMQDLGVKFMFVKEARELWRAYCAAP